MILKRQRLKILQKKICECLKHTCKVIQHQYSSKKTEVRYFSFTLTTRMAKITDWQHQMWVTM